jgi:hypothetical protein
MLQRDVIIATPGGPLPSEGKGHTLTVVKKKRGDGVESKITIHSDRD